MTLLPWKGAGPASPSPGGPGERARGGGSPSEFEDLALPLLPALYNLAMWLTRNSGDAEDLVQETMLKALRGFCGFQQGTNFKAWIFRILRNTFLTSRSGLASRRTVALEDELEAAHPESAIDRETPELNLIRLSDHAAVEGAMEKLPSPFLEVLLLCDVEEMKYREIANVLEVPVGTVMSRIARARAQLRRLLEEAAPQTKGVRA